MACREPREKAGVRADEPASPARLRIAGVLQDQENSSVRPAPQTVSPFTPLGPPQFGGLVPSPPCGCAPKGDGFLTRQLLADCRNIGGAARFAAWWPVVFRCQPYGEA